MRYRVLAPLQLHPGALIGLTEAQLRRRRELVELLPDGLARVLKPCGFKAGEEFDHVGPLPKTLAAELVPDAAPAGQAAEPPSQAQADPAAPAASKRPARKAAR